ncbi:hypothetical protein [Sphingomonas xinjiangensis]|uniref:Uncharacterized protein n=1 Tax=Sphingomonas xinjiangensis TaxID=643568 RepID=A0A840YSI4_9SPHN|nr:hypothetical protein [Sphingomonas xinjiangensis]MBB5712613.1 hypothetical protein [Sphingomonas xinjiangensis]
MGSGRILRAFALLVLGAMLLVRMGPLCETAAQAAAPAAAHAAMADCEEAPRSPAKKVPGVACAGPCIAAEPQDVAPVGDVMVVSVQPAVQLHSPLEGRSAGPAPPPPRAA